MPAFRIRSFSRPELVAALTNRHAVEKDLAKRKTVDYLHGYLANLGARSLLVENPYTDGDFLDDYTAYYARCFTAYDRRC